MGEGAQDEDYTPLVPQVRVRVAVDCATPEQFIAEYHRFVDGDRIFIATDVTETVGNLVQFRVDLGGGRAVLHGTGTVLQVRPAHDGLPRGMVLQFIALDESSARIVEAMSRLRSRATPADGVLSMEAPPAGSDELAPRPATPTPDLADALDSQAETRSFSRRIDSTAPFRLGEGGPDARQTWTTRSVEREGVLPANPFSDVSDLALAYFVDWAIERNGASSTAAPAVVAFHDVRMEAPRRRRRRPPAWVSFVVGLGVGGAGIATAFDLWRDVAVLARPRPTAQMPTVTREVLQFPPVVVERDAPKPQKPAPKPTPKPTGEPSEPLPAAPPPTAPAIAKELDGKLVALSVTADPGAQVFVDGQKMGRTPLTLKVLRGAHVVELQRPRYQTQHLDVEAPGKTAVHLERPRATLHVTSNVADAEVFVDGEPAGKVPASVEVAGYERCQVEVRAGARVWKKKLYVRPPLTDVPVNLD